MHAGGQGFDPPRLHHVSRSRPNDGFFSFPGPSRGIEPARGEMPGGHFAPEPGGRGPADSRSDSGVFCTRMKVVNDRWPMTSLLRTLYRAKSTETELVNGLAAALRGRCHSQVPVSCRMDCINAGLYFIRRYSAPIFNPVSVLGGITPLYRLVISICWHFKINAPVVRSIICSSVSIGYAF